MQYETCATWSRPTWVDANHSLQATPPEAPDGPDWRLITSSFNGEYMFWYWERPVEE